MPKQRLQQKQKFNLTPQQIQFLSLLQIPLSSLNSRIQEELEENPALEESEKSEDVSIEEFRAQFETNFFSVVRMIQKVVPIMRKQGTGDIVNISSIAGRIGFPVSTAYISSKDSFKWSCNHNYAPRFSP